MDGSADRRLPSFPRVKRLARAPLFHFLAIGALLFAARQWQARRSAGETARIMIPAADVSALRREWALQTGRAPTPAEERALLDKAIDDELLYREALRLGLDRGDKVVRGRLIQLARYVSDDPGRPDDALVQDAVGLGLERSDAVIRRYLIASMRLVARRPDEPRPITDAELEAVLEREADRYREPPAVTLTQVFLSAAKRGAALDRDARALARRLRSKRVSPAAAPALGDGFPLGARFARASDGDLDKAFGTGFARALAGAKAGEWSGPVRSAYGAHLVWLEERFPARLPALDAVRTQLVQRVREERAEERLRRRLAELRRRTAVRVEEAPPADVSREAAAAASTGRRPPQD